MKNQTHPTRTEDMNHNVILTQRCDNRKSSDVQQDQRQLSFGSNKFHSDTKRNHQLMRGDRREQIPHLLHAVLQPHGEPSKTAWKLNANTASKPLKELVSDSSM